MKLPLNRPLFLKLLFRGDLEAEEYEETKNDTMEQLKELNDSLNRLVKGDISLVSALGAVQLVRFTVVVRLLCSPVSYFCRRRKLQSRRRSAHRKL